MTGSGTIYGSVNAFAESTINPGDTIGTLTIFSGATLNGLLLMELNRTNAQTSDQLVCYGNMAYAGTLAVTNLGPALKAGDSFQLFNQAVTGFSSVNLPALGAALIWTNKIALDGTIQVLANVSLAPASIVAQPAGTSLAVTWPADHTGWRLQMQTNSLSTGLSTNWTDVESSIDTNQMTLPINPATGSSFFRLVYP